ncbi:MAG: ATP-binding protein [Myxococcota bacterium]
MSNAVLDLAVLHAILEHSPNVIVLTDLDMKILYLNRVDRGDRVEDKIGTPYCSSLPPQQAVKFEAAFARARQTGRPQHVPHVVDAPAGPRKWYSTVICALDDDDGQPRGYLDITTDVTDQHDAEQELERTRKELLEASHRAGMAEVTTGVLHNVGNVLNSIGVSASALTGALASSRLSVLPRIAKLLEEHADRLADFMTHDPRGRKLPALVMRLSDELLAERERLEANVARLSEHLDLMRETIEAQQTAAKTAGKVEAVEPRTLVERVLSMFRSKLDHRAIEVSVRCTPEGRRILDPRSTLHILANLVINAIEALEAMEGGPRRLTVRVSERADQLEFEVEDNGIGIPKDRLTQIFHHGFTTKTSGHGFGLHSSTTAATMMNGSVIAHSEGPGRGSVFRLRVPRIMP